MLAALLARLRPRCPPTSTDALPRRARHARPAGARRAARRRARGHGRSTSSPTAAWSCIDACARHPPLRRRRRRAPATGLSCGDRPAAPARRCPGSAGDCAGSLARPCPAADCAARPARSPLGLAVLVGVAGSDRRAGRRPRSAPTASSASTTVRARCSRSRPTTRRPRTTCSSAPTPARASTPTIANAGGHRHRRGRRRPAQRHDHGPAPRAQRRRRAAEPAPRPVGADRRHRRARPRSTRPTTRARSASAPTITQALGIPINHYVEIDFAGFTAARRRRSAASRSASITPAQDTHSGLDLEPGCHEPRRRRRRSPTPAAATTRSGSTASGSDDGTRRPRPHRAPAAVHPHGGRHSCCSEIEGDPFTLGELDRRGRVGGHASTRALDPVKAADALREAAEAGLSTYSLPVEFAEHDDQSALDLADGEAQPILDYFRGVGPPPPPTTAGDRRRRPTTGG